MILFLSIVLAIVVAAALSLPHFGTSEEASVGSENNLAESLADQKDRYLQLMKDLELDFATGKLSESDYGRMRGPLSAELGQLLTRIDESRNA